MRELICTIKGLTLLLLIFYFYFFKRSKREQSKISGGIDTIKSLFKLVAYNLTDKWFSFPIKGNSKPPII